MPDTPPADERPGLDFKKVLPIFVIIVVDLLGLTIIIPLLPLYAVSFGASEFVIGLLAAAYPAMQFVGAPILGRLSDRFGRKPVLIASQIGTFAGFILLGFADALWLLFAARIIDGLTGGNISVAQAVITDSTSEEARTQGLGLVGAAFGLGFIIGPVITFASLAASGSNYHVPALVAAAFSLMSILLTTLWLTETLPPEKRLTQAETGEARGVFAFGRMIAALGRPGIGILFALLFTQQLAFGGFEQFLAVFTLNRLGMGASDNSLLFVFVGVIVVAVQGYFVGRWSRRLGDRRLIYIGLGALAVGFCLVAFTPRQPLPWYSREEIAAELNSGASFQGGEIAASADTSVDLPDEDAAGWLGIGWLLAAMIPVAVGGGILQPAINSLLTKRVDGDEVGGTLGLSSAFYSAANVAAPLIMGVLFSLLGTTAPFLAAGLLLAALLGLAIQRVRPGREQAAPAGLARGADRPTEAEAG